MSGSDFYLPESSTNIELAASDSLRKARSVKILRQMAFRETNRCHIR
jgi:hypothetical protein